MVDVNRAAEESITDEIREGLNGLPGLIESGPVWGTSFPVIFKSYGRVVEATIEVTDINVYFGEV